MRIMSNKGEEFEKEQLIEKIMGLQRMLQEMTQRIEGVSSENQKLRDENVMLKDYINSLMQKAGNLTNESLS